MSTALLCCNHEHCLQQLSTLATFCPRTGIAGYSAGVITAIAVAVAVAVAVSTPGDDYDPSNGWIEVQDVPPDYDQRIIQQVRCPAALAKFVAGFMSSCSIDMKLTINNHLFATVLCEPARRCSTAFAAGGLVSPQLGQRPGGGLPAR
jgi:hypothetical protein